MNLIALDIGGSKIEAILWRSGKIIFRHKIPTPRKRQTFLAAVFSVIKTLKSRGRARGIGISLAGAIDMRTGKIESSPNLRFIEGLNLQGKVENKFGVKTRVLNDAKCFLLGELNFGAARGKRNVIGLVIGTGFGGAVCLDGRLLYGAHGFAGEQGRMILSYPSVTIENLISSHGFRRLGISDPLGCQNRAFAGEKKAIAVYNRIGKYLGIHLANLNEIFDPEMIVIGGSISRAGRLLLVPAKKETEKHLTRSKKVRPIIATSRLSNAGLLGAVSLFLSPKNKKALN